MNYYFDIALKIKHNKVYLFSGEYICELETYGDPIHQINKLHVLGNVIDFADITFLVIWTINLTYNSFSKIYVLLIVPPVISMLNPGRNITVRKGSTVKLVCNATGFPKPEIVWERQVRFNSLLVKVFNFTCDDKLTQYKCWKQYFPIS